MTADPTGAAECQTMASSSSKDCPRNKVGFEPTAHYAVRQVEGWKVLVNRGLLSRRAQLANETLSVLRHQLYQLARRIPRAAARKLRTIRIWVEENEPHTSCMTYHPDPGWLRAQGMNPAKARCIELANPRNFLKWTLEQPWMVLHELAHGYHHQFLDGGFANVEIKTRYDRAMKARRYHSVLGSNGRRQKAYAATNPMEYFAEATEAYFGTNDYYPFVRSELHRHDPRMFELLRKLWRDE
jgi:hypothetical protein